MSLAYVPLHSLRRAFVAATCALVGSFVSPASFAWDLTILHVNDVHSAAAGVNDRGPVYDDTNAVGGLARVTAFVADEKAKAKVQGKAVMALDAGDFWQGTHFFRTGGMPWAREAMRRMPWDAVTLGNHEFDLGCETLARYVKSLPFPVLAANLEKNPACPLSTAPLPATVVKDFNGVKVGIIGLVNDEGKDISEACPKTNFADRATALRRAAAELEKSGVTHIIAVTHVGYEADQALARAVPAIDVIVGGHTHSVLGNHPHSEAPTRPLFGMTTVHKRSWCKRDARLAIWDGLRFSSTMRAASCSLRATSKNSFQANVAMKRCTNSLFGRLRLFEPIRSVSWESTRRRFPTGSIPVVKATASREWRQPMRFSPGAALEVQSRRF